MKYQPESWTKRASGALVLVLAVAVGARVAWALLAPAIPVLVALVGLLAVYAVLFRRR